MIRLKQLREELGINQTTFSKQLGFGQSTVSNWENGNRVLDVNTATMLAKFFDVSVDYLLGNSDIREKTPSEEGVNFDNFTYALFDETKDLTDADKEMLLNMAKMLKERKDKEK